LSPWSELFVVEETYHVAGLSRTASKNVDNSGAVGGAAALEVGAGAADLPGLDLAGGGVDFHGDRDGGRKSGGKATESEELEKLHLACLDGLTVTGWMGRAAGELRLGMDRGWLMSWRASVRLRGNIIYL
jgi:hypothetical protein